MKQYKLCIQIIIIIIVIKKKDKNQKEGDIRTEECAREGENFYFFFFLRFSLRFIEIGP